MLRSLFKKAEATPGPYASTPLNESDNPFNHAGSCGHWRCPNCMPSTTSNSYPGPWNPIYYNRGTHPLGKLKCPTCRTVWNPDFETTDCLRVFPTTGDDPVPVPLLEGPRGELRKQVPYLTICRCGLTHRAKNLTPSTWLGGNGRSSCIGFQHIVCECGAKFDSSWKRYSIRPDPVYVHVGHEEYLYIAEYKD